HSHTAPTPPPVASPIKWLLEQSQCDDALDTWFADVGLYVGEEEKERRGWEERERVEWFKGEEEEEDDDDEEGEEESSDLEGLGAGEEWEAGEDQEEEDA
ncbi:hypothetical protein EUX98_g9641, partial [Antrodiella citrinella]